MKQIVCLSTTCWHPLPTRKQNVMKRLHGVEVLYFDPPVSLIAPLKDKRASERLFKYRAREGEKPQDNITVYALPPVLPFFNRFRLINRVNQFFQARYIRKRMKRHGFENPVLWCYSPTACDAARRIPHRALVYDCVDRHSAYKGMIDPGTVDRMEEDLARAADMVFCTASGLYETLSKYNPKTALVPNGCAYELFSRVAAETFAVPPELSDIEGPVFGFVGMLQECIDYDMIEHLAQSRPDYTVALIGRPLPGVDLSRLRACKNIRFIDVMPQEKLPAYLARFDACLNLFRAGALSKDVSPLKFYEYLATGKPIVTTPEPLQVADYASVVYLARTKEEFVARCAEAAAERDAALRAQRLAYGKACSWDARVEQIERELQKDGIL